MITEAELLKENISSALYEGKLYFDVEQVREAFPYTKFPPEKIKPLLIGFKLHDTILAVDIEDMNDFDLMILQTLNFNPQKR